MDMIKRGIQDSVSGQTPPKAVVIFGARRIGKTTLLEQIVDRNTSAWYTGDNFSDMERLKLLSEGDVKTLLFQSDTLVIDEAQRIPDIGLLLKRLVDVNMTLAQIKTTLQRHHGPAQVLLYLPDGRTLKTDSDLWGEISEPLRLQLTAILGSGNVKME